MWAVVKQNRTNKTKRKASLFLKKTAEICKHRSAFCTRVILYTVPLALFLCDANCVGDTQSFRYPSLLNGSANGFTPESLVSTRTAQSCCLQGKPSEGLGCPKRHLMLGGKTPLARSALLRGNHKTSRTVFGCVSTSRVRLSWWFNSSAVWGHGMTCETLGVLAVKSCKDESRCQLHSSFRMSHNHGFF